MNSQQLSSINYSLDVTWRNMIRQKLGLRVNAKITRIIEKQYIDKYGPKPAHLKHIR